MSSQFISLSKSMQ